MPPRFPIDPRVSRSEPNFEVPERQTRIGNQILDAFDASPRRTLPDLGQQLCDLIRRTADANLDPSVCEVAYITQHAATPGRLLHEPAESDALDPSGDHPLRGGPIPCLGVTSQRRILQIESWRGWSGREDWKPPAPCTQIPL